MIRLFTMDDYDYVYKLWISTPGMGLRDMDDSKEGIERLLRRNPTTSFIAEENGRIVGAALGGHDGRRGHLYHVCVAEQVRRRSIGTQLVDHVIEAMKAEKITRLDLSCYKNNESGNGFWSKRGWNHRSDLNVYSYSTDEEYTYQS